MKINLQLPKKIIEQIRRFGVDATVVGPVGGINNIVNVEMDVKNIPEVFVIGHKCGMESGKQLGQCKVIVMDPYYRRKSA